MSFIVQFVVKRLSSWIKQLRISPKLLKIGKNATQKNAGNRILNISKKKVEIGQLLCLCPPLISEYFHPQGSQLNFDSYSKLWF